MKVDDILNKQLVAHLNDSLAESSVLSNTSQRSM